MLSFFASTKAGGPGSMRSACTPMRAHSSKHVSPALDFRLIVIGQQDLRLGSSLCAAATSLWS